MVVTPVRHKEEHPSAEFSLSLDPLSILSLVHTFKRMERPYSSLPTKLLR